MSLPAPNLLLDPTTWDLVLTDGNLVLCTGDNAVTQACYERARFFKGEWYADEDIGIPYLGTSNTDRQAILGNTNLNLNMVREVFRQSLLNTPGIATVESVTVSKNSATRLLTVSWVATQDDGTRQVVDGFQV